MKSLTKQKETHRLRVQTFGCQGKGRKRQGVGDGHVHTDISRMDNQQEATL